MSEAKLTIVKNNEHRAKVLKIINIDERLHRQLAELKDETGVGIQQLAEKFIRFGIENVEIVEE